MIRRNIWITRNHQTFYHDLIQLLKNENPEIRNDVRKVLGKLDPVGLHLESHHEQAIQHYLTHDCREKRIHQVIDSDQIEQILKSLQGQEASLSK